MDGIKRRSESEEWRSAPHFQSGEKHPRYKGNRRRSREGSQQYEYSKWRKSVLKKCNYTCQQCGIRGGKLEAHHVEPWAENAALRLDVDNGIALCQDCHIAIHGHQRKPPTKTCKQCKQRFVPKKTKQKFCNRDCFMAWWRID